MPDEHPDQPRQDPASKSSRYESNPFRAAGVGLAALARWNVVPAVLLFVYLVLGLLLAILLLAILGLVPGGAVIAILVFLGMVLALFALSGAAIAMSLASLDGREEKFGKYWRIGVRRLPALVILTALMSLVIYGGLLLLLVPGIIAIAWLAYAPFILIDEEVGPLDAMKRSVRLARGHFAETWGAIFASTTLVANGFLVLTGPAAGMAARYRQLKELKMGSEASPRVHWVNYALPVLMIIIFIIGVTLAWLAPDEDELRREAQRQQAEQQMIEQQFEAPEAFE